jgi:hypothetical protein
MKNLIKWIIIGPFLLLNSSCAWLNAHPQVETDVIEVGKVAAEQALEYLEKP